MESTNVESGTWVGQILVVLLQNFAKTSEIEIDVFLQVEESVTKSIHLRQIEKSET